MSEAKASTSAAGPEVVLGLRSVSKRFGRVVACDDVSLNVRAGEIRGLLGQNGAGKSTLMKIVAGFVRPEAGEIRIRGETLGFGDPVIAAERGIAMVHQHFSLVGPMPVWKNVTLSDRGHKKVDRTGTSRQIREIGQRYGLDVDPDAIVDDLAVGERQRVELLKCLRRQPDILILDEPTSVLTREESTALFGVLRRLARERGQSVVLISHELEEMLEVTDRVTVLRDGRVVSTVESAEASPDSLAQEMLGHDVTVPAEVLGLTLDEPGKAAGVPGSLPARSGVPSGHRAAVLELSDITVASAVGHKLLDGVSLDVGEGEILGVAGVAGNGQEELTGLLSNLIRPDGGEVRVEGRTIQTGRGRQLSRAGVGVIPADRHDSGCVLEMSVAENIALGSLDGMVRWGVVQQQKLHQLTQRLVGDFRIITSSLSAPLRSLSGGNQQRVVLARELARRPCVLVAAEPTQGLDIGARGYIWDRLREAAAGGTGILLLSSDLAEIMALSHRVAVINRGRIVSTMARADVDLAELGRMMGARTHDRR
ncbi:MAG: ABC transporter ATP-binding protein [Acidimicrobiia bacterium]|nr:ABC transporter ATP-binding protein [Acidimicrobiia bacterium]